MGKPWQYEIWMNIQPAINELRKLCKEGMVQTVDQVSDKREPYVSGVTEGGKENNDDIEYETDNTIAAVQERLRVSTS